jgi:hypothetical protein
MSEDPEEEVLPIEFGPVSNDEYLPAPPTPVMIEAVRRLRELTDDTAPRLGLSRRAFLRSSRGTWPSSAPPCPPRLSPVVCERR